MRSNGLIVVSRYLVPLRPFETLDSDRELLIMMRPSSAMNDGRMMKGPTPVGVGPFDDGVSDGR